MRRPWSCARGDGDYGTRVAVYSAAAVGGKHDKDILAGLRCFRSEGWEDEDNCGSLSRPNPRVWVAGERELTVGGREELRLTAHKAGVRGAKPRYNARRAVQRGQLGRQKILANFCMQFQAYCRQRLRCSYGQTTPYRLDTLRPRVYEASLQDRQLLHRDKVTFGLSKLES